MSKEDKQIIDRGIKENWRIGDRTRLKRLLEKNLKLYRENVELEQENAGLKERLETLNLNANIAVRDLNDLLTKAKEIIKDFIILLTKSRTALDTKTYLMKAEQFLEKVK